MADRYSIDSLLNADSDKPVADLKEDKLSTGEEENNNVQPDIIDSEPNTDNESSEDSHQEVKETDHEEDIQHNTDDSNEDNRKQPEEKDEYGNSIKKQRMYSEEEVNRKIRERVARIKEEKLFQQQQAQQPQQPQQPANNNPEVEFQFDENSNLNWQQQLDHFVNQSIEKREKKIYQQQQQQREQQEKSEFDNRFTQGISKYPDFVETMEEHFISDAMVTATRAMKDPAGFLYAAVKKFPAEVKRISQLPNWYQQAAELGRLDERMRAPKVTTKAPKPINNDRSDFVEKPKPKGNNVDIDALIQKDANSRLKRR